MQTNYITGYNETYTQIEEYLTNVQQLKDSVTKKEFANSFKINKEDIDKLSKQVTTMIEDNKPITFKSKIDNSLTNVAVFQKELIKHFDDKVLPKNEFDDNQTHFLETMLEYISVMKNEIYYKKIGDDASKFNSFVSNNIFMSSDCDNILSDNVIAEYYLETAISDTASLEYDLHEKEIKLLSSIKKNFSNISDMFEPKEFDNFKKGDNFKNIITQNIDNMNGNSYDDDFIDFIVAYFRYLHSVQTGTEVDDEIKLLKENLIMNLCKLLQKSDLFKYLLSEEPGEINSLYSLFIDFVKYEYIQLIKLSKNKSDIYSKNIDSKKNKKTKMATITNKDTPTDFKIFQIENNKKELINSLKKDIDKLMNETINLKRKLFDRVEKIEKIDLFMFDKNIKKFLDDITETLEKFEGLRQEYKESLNKNEMGKLNILLLEQYLKQYYIKLNSMFNKLNQTLNQANDLILVSQDSISNNEINSLDENLLSNEENDSDVSISISDEIDSYNKFLNISKYLKEESIKQFFNTIEFKSIVNNVAISIYSFKELLNKIKSEIKKYLEDFLNSNIYFSLSKTIDTISDFLGCIEEFLKK